MSNILYIYICVKERERESAEAKIEIGEYAELEKYHPRALQWK